MHKYVTYYGIFTIHIIDNIIYIYTCFSLNFLFDFFPKVNVSARYLPILYAVYIGTNSQ